MLFCFGEKQLTKQDVRQALVTIVCVFVVYFLFRVAFYIGYLLDEEKAAKENLR
jgi:hypothetical protein